MVWRGLNFAAAVLVTFLSLFGFEAFASAQLEPATADEIIAKYLDAIGAKKISSINSFVEKGEFSAKTTSPTRRFDSPEQTTFEITYKAPNLHFGLILASNSIWQVHGCDGDHTWYIDHQGHLTRFTPKPGNEYDCKAGFEPMPLRVRDPKLKLRLKGKKKIADRIAWAVEVQSSQSQSPETYFFDTESFLLLRSKTSGYPSYWGGRMDSGVEQNYSDYRDVGGIKLPFRVEEHSEHWSRVTILKEVELNNPVDDARFKEPSVTAEGKNAPPRIEFPQQRAIIEPPNNIDNAEAAAITAPPSMPSVAKVSVIRSIDFVSSPLAALQLEIPELKGLKAAENQNELKALLAKVGRQTQEIYQKIPNLISHEEVFESQPGVKATKEDFSYLILNRTTQNARVLEEYRVDLQSGTALETDDTWKPGQSAASDSASSLKDLPQASQKASSRKSGAPPLSQGFSSMWLRFYPTNISESNFRYLGRQKLDRHETFVLVFAQIPGKVRLPGEIRFSDRSIPVYYQGVAWVDASDFRIVRLRQDLLPLAADLALTELTAEVQFASTPVTGFAAPLWLPREVEVTSQVNGFTFHDKHMYSKYHSFQSRSRIVLPQD